MSFIRKILEAGAVVPFIRVPFKASASSETRLRRDLADFGRMLHAQGFVAATDGNLSVRLDEERVMVTPSGYSKGSLEPEQMVIVDLEGQKLSGSCCPTSEIGVHLTIYRMRPDVGAVVHAHPCTATGFASAGIALDEPLCSEIVITLGSVPLAPYATPGSPELSENLKPFIPDHDAILMANHGVVTCAEDLQHAYMKMEAVEHYAKIVMVARQLGGTRPLDRQELAKLMELRTRYLRNGH